ncbi:MAG: hypothetical protein M3Q32_10085, partial [Pseudomonadota bacterium]|nr:hypothetical protein [Pseudomonadota bacterium]
MDTKDKLRTNPQQRARSESAEMSFPRTREGAFTFEVQRFKESAEYLGRRSKAQAFTRGVIIGG